MSRRTRKPKTAWKRSAVCVADRTVAWRAGGSGRWLTAATHNPAIGRRHGSGKKRS